MILMFGLSIIVKVHITHYICNHDHYTECNYSAGTYSFAKISSSVTSFSTFSSEGDTSSSVVSLSVVSSTGAASVSSAVGATSVVSAAVAHSVVSELSTSAAI